MKVLALVVLALLLPQEKKSEAEKIFRKMEAKILQAKTLRAKVLGTLEKPEKTECSIDLLIDEANRARFNVDMKVAGGARSLMAISDGNEIEFTSMPRYPAPESFGKLTRKALAAGGGFMAVDAFGNGACRLDPDTAYQLSDFALAPRETVGNIDAEVVEYKLDTKHVSDITLKVWIDPKTHLPLKRTMTSKRQTSEETYTDLKLDEKIDPATFELPKDAK